MSAPTYRIIPWSGGPIACEHYDAGWLIVWDDDPDHTAGPFESKESALLHVTAFLEELAREEEEYARLEESYENPEDSLYLPISAEEQAQFDRDCAEAEARRDAGHPPYCNGPLPIPGDWLRSDLLDPIQPNEVRE